MPSNDPGAIFDRAAINAKVRASLPFKHRYHNRFHLEMPFGLINDPNGLVEKDGITHIFYQWNPLGVEHKHKCWAHTQTRDFVHYTAPELALWPSDAHDKDGCYSGCGLVEDGDVRVLYTCNAKDAQGVRTPAQRFGTLQADGTIRKDEIIIPTNAEGYTGHFRDPYVFYRHGERYLVLGAQRADETGTVLVYHEDKDSKTWEPCGEISTKYKDFGYMWECPNLLRFGNYDVLLFCPQGLEAREYKYQSRYQCGYLAGHLSLESMELMHGRFQELDKGFDFYAPQVYNNQGRHILFGWIGMPDEDAYPTKEHGWVHSLTMPRVLTLRQGKIFSQPAKELRELRIADSAVDIDATETQHVRAGLGEGAEALIDITFGKAQSVTYTLAYGLERVTIRYDRPSQTVVIDRSGMKYGGKGTRTFKLFTDQNLSLQLFVDKTVVEAFFEHGEEVATFNVFPEKYILPELLIESDAPMENVTGRVWELDAYQYR
ncbi:MAG: glycoside hydrolase family 32 protein [Selenomonas sp.]|uniref:glycoside hydrolase family 32 protein n=2 Tax=Selenomonas sp. TaxID=2053611 RepID=UPI0025D85CAE|nr:glycoside hydrolase family 32 protein [Selenomonas sp.]MCI6085247.1 glycoside hydrolase family 32 protein [Selenomonas sp.]MDY4415852.1 glycoside hydrolase family 32 protein [Selenomonas sp.]